MSLLPHALVSGAAGAIGNAIEHALIRDGYAVTATDLPTVALQHERLLPMDVSDEQSVEIAVADAVRHRGPIELLVNAAGVFAHGPALEETTDVWDHLFAVNARGVFLLSQSVGRRMAERRRGSIITIASNAGAVPRAGMAAYAASKAAASSITRSLGLELGPYGVRCNVIAPGTTRSSMITGLATDEEFVAGFPSSYKSGIPLGRIAEPEDIAETVAFVASERARHLTLQEIVVDGGASQR